MNVTKAHAVLRAFAMASHMRYYNLFGPLSMHDVAQRCKDTPNGQYMLCKALVDGNRLRQPALVLLDHVHLKIVVKPLTPTMPIQ